LVTRKGDAVFTIALVCQKGGAGKTTLAVHLAIETQRRGLRTLLLDLDAQASASKILGRRGDDPPDFDTEHPARLEDTLRKAEAEGYELIVLDTAPQADQAALRAARAADLVIVPVRPTIVDMDAVQTTMDICALAKRDPIFVLNAVAPQGREGAEAREVITGRGGKVAAAQLGDRKAFRTAFNDGRGAQEVEPSSKAAAEIDALVSELHIPTTKQRNKVSRKKVAA
jgi:chromosome partitioning protein